MRYGLNSAVHNEAAVHWWVRVVEEFFVVAPAVVESKTRYGFEWFEAKWREALGETGQGSLFV